MSDPYLSMVREIRRLHEQYRAGAIPFSQVLQATDPQDEHELARVIKADAGAIVIYTRRLDFDRYANETQINPDSEPWLAAVHAHARSLNETDEWEWDKAIAEARRFALDSSRPMKMRTQPLALAPKRRRAAFWLTPPTVISMLVVVLAVGCAAGWHFTTQAQREKSAALAQAEIALSEKEEALAKKEAAAKADDISAELFAAGFIGERMKESERLANVTEENKIKFQLLVYLTQYPNGLKTYEDFERFLNDSNP